MRSVISTVASLIAAATVASAQYSNQSAPFNLVLVSDNSTISGQYLYACHEGAAIEGLCLRASPTANDVFRYNYTETPDYTSPSGYLTWVLHGGNFNLTEPMQLSFNPASNVALPLFEPSQIAQPIVFDNETDFLQIPAYIDDRVYPAARESTALSRWFVCITSFGYTYQTLTWTFGEAPPQNPTCVKTEVKRVFVEEQS